MNWAWVFPKCPLHPIPSHPIRFCFKTMSGMFIFCQCFSCDQHQQYRFRSYWNWNDPQEKRKLRGIGAQIEKERWIMDLIWRISKDRGPQCVVPEAEFFTSQRIKHGGFHKGDASTLSFPRCYGALPIFFNFVLGPYVLHLFFSKRFDCVGPYTPTSLPMFSFFLGVTLLFYAIPEWSICLPTWDSFHGLSHSGFCFISKCWTVWDHPKPCTILIVYIMEAKPWGKSQHWIIFLCIPSPFSKWESLQT